MISGSSHGSGAPGTYAPARAPYSNLPAPLKFPTFHIDLTNSQMARGSGEAFSGISNEVVFACKKIAIFHIQEHSK